MKALINLIIIAFIAVGSHSHAQGNRTKDQSDLDKTTKAIRDAFGRGDVAAIVALHHPNIVKYFGGTNVVNGRAELEKGLTQMLKNSTMEFVENKVESTLFNGKTIVQTSLFGIKITPKNGGKPTFARGRSMVVYVRYKDSPTGWASIREMAQQGPEK